MTENLQETTPTHKKKMQWFGVIIVLLLSSSLILSIFSNTKKVGKSGDGKELAESSVDSDLSQSALKFQEGIQREVANRQRLNAEKARQDQSGVAGRNDQNGQQQPEEGESIEAKFKSSEAQRALKARISKFNLATTNNQEGGPAKTGKLVALKKMESARQSVTDDIQHVRERVKKFQDELFKNNGKLSVPEEGKAVSKVEDKTIVGQPGSESAPKPGQKLLRTATLINGVLDQKLMSDYIGPYRGLISHDVYDASKAFVLIPKGCRIVGECLRISNVNEPIQARMGLTVKWIILPDGSRISLEKKATALDQAGIPAIKDDVNYHFFAQFMGVVAYSILGIETSYEGTGDDSDETFAGNMSQSARKQFEPLAAKYLNIVPTITLNIGTPLKIFLEDDIYAYPWSSLGQKLYNADRTQ